MRSPGQLDAAQAGLKFAFAEGSCCLVLRQQALEPAVSEAAVAEAGAGLEEIEEGAADQGGGNAGCHLLAGDAAAVPVQQGRMGRLQRAHDAAGQGEAVFEKEAADVLDRLSAEVIALGAGRLGEDVEVDVGLVEAAAREGAEQPSLFGNTAVVYDEPGNPGLRRHIDIAPAGELGRCAVGARPGIIRKRGPEAYFTQILTHVTNCKRENI